MPSATPDRFVSQPRTVAIVGCPFSGGQRRAGVDEGPIQLVQAGLLEQIKELGWNVEFDGHHQFEEVNALDDPDVGKIKRPRMVSGVCKAVSDVVYEHAKKGSLPVTLGGDHSLAMGTVSGVLRQHPDACLIWIDAHADINTPDSTDTGNLHGCPVSFLLGLKGTAVAPFNTWLTSPAQEKPILDASRLVYIGLRDVDTPEKRILKENGIRAFSMHEVDKHGIGKVVEMALDAVNPGRDRPIHLSFDVDALDPTVAPSTGTPVRGGLTFREGHYICEAIAETGLLVGLDLMEVNPSLQDPEAVAQTVKVGCSLIRSSLGETLL